MATHRLQPNFCETVHEAHEDLRELLRTIEQVSALRTGSDEILAGRLADLKIHLRLHFEHEEEGGYFHEVVAAAPWLAEQAAALEQEHAQLMELLDGLLETFRPTVRQPVGRPAVNKCFEEFNRLFHKHEAAEAQLVQQAFNDDLGAAD